MRGLNPRFEGVTVTGCCCWCGVSGGHKRKVATAGAWTVTVAPGFKDAAHVKEAITKPWRDTPDVRGTVVDCTDVEGEGLREVVDVSGDVDVVVSPAFAVPLCDEEQALKSSPAEVATRATRVARPLACI